MHSPAREFIIGDKSPLHFRSSSRGLLGSWMILEQYGIMIDCGDGAASLAARSLCGVKDILITHSHLDHLSGLTAVLNLQHRLNPDPNFRPSLHYTPESHQRIQASLSMLGKKSRDRLSLKPFESPKLASVTKLQELPEIPLETENPKEQAEQTRHHRRIRVLPTRHCKGSVGFLLTEERRRLKPEWETKQHLIGEIMRGLSQQERSAAKKDMEEVQEVILVAHLGDTPKLDEREISLLSQAPMGYLILEATMLNKEDFQENPNGTEGVINDGGEEADTHSTLDESVESFRKINPKHLLLNHFSPRYGTKEILQALSKSLTPEERKSNRIHALIGGDLKNLSLEPKPPKINNFNTDISY